MTPCFFRVGRLLSLLSALQCGSPRDARPVTAIPAPATSQQSPPRWLAGDSTGAQPTLAYWRVGQQRTVVIVLHGGPGTTHTYLRPEWDALATGATVVYYDQRGTGRSDGSACYSWQAHLADLHRLIEAVAPGQRVVLAGSSWGSMLALLYAYHYPRHVRALILSGTYAWPGQGAPALPCPPWLTPAARHEQWQQRPATTQSDTLVEWALSSRTRHRTKAVLFSAGPPLRDALASWPSAPPADSLHHIRLPVLIVRGDQQIVIADGGAALGRVLSNATLFTIAGAGHDPWLADPNAFFQRCRTFLQQSSK